MSDSPRRNPLRLLSVVVTLGGVGALACVLWSGGRLAELQAWIDALGPRAVAAFIAVRALATVALVPGSYLSAMAGPLFGTWKGVLCVSAGKTLGAAAAFLIARYAARDKVARRLAAGPRGARVEELTREHGVAVVALLRLVPVVPFNLQNYAFGLTSVRFRTYLVWTWLAMLPGAVVVVTGTGILAEFRATDTIGNWGRVGVFFCAFGVMAVGGLWALVRLVRAWLRSSRSRR